MFDRGFHLTLLAMRRQLAAMPHDLYLVRLIHCQTRRAFPGERLWTVAQLTHPATIRFLRVRNREGCDVYLHPYAEERNPGYSLVDLDGSNPVIVETMRAAGHEPCVVLQTSPGNLQAWVRVSATPIPAAVASQISQTVGPPLRRRPSQHRLASPGPLGRFHQSETDATQPGRLLALGEGAARSRRLGFQAAALLEEAERRLGSHSNLALAPHVSLAAPAHPDATGTDGSAGSTPFQMQTSERVKCCCFRVISKNDRGCTHGHPCRFQLLVTNSALFLLQSTRIWRHFEWILRDVLYEFRPAMASTRVRCIGQPEFCKVLQGFAMRCLLRNSLSMGISLIVQYNGGHWI